jgi:phosphohistidine phosphatase
MRTLSLLRHAKSSWDDPELTDHERGLNGRGLRDAPRMGRFIRNNGLVPDLVLCSDAVRTRETMRLVLAEWGAARPRVVYDAALYLAEPVGILKLLAKVDANIGHCLVVGHNPGLEDLAVSLAETGEPHALADLGAKFPTCALAVIDLPVEGWKGLRPGTGNLRMFVVPRALG